MIARARTVGRRARTPHATLAGGVDRDGRGMVEAGWKVAALGRISHRLTGKAHDRPAITSLRLLAVLTVLFKYASARQAARASY